MKNVISARLKKLFKYTALSLALIIASQLVFSAGAASERAKADNGIGYYILEESSGSSPDSTIMAAGSYDTEEHTVESAPVTIRKNEEAQVFAPFIIDNQTEYKTPVSALQIASMTQLESSAIRLNSIEWHNGDTIQANDKLVLRLPSQFSARPGTYFSAKVNGSTLCISAEPDNISTSDDRSVLTFALDTEQASAFAGAAAFDEVEIGHLITSAERLHNAADVTDWLVGVLLEESEENEEIPTGRLTLLRYRRYSDDTEPGEAVANVSYTIYSDYKSATENTKAKDIDGKEIDTISTYTNGTTGEITLPAGLDYYIVETPIAMESPFHANATKVENGTTVLTAETTGAYKVNIAKDTATTLTFTDIADTDIQTYPTKNLVFNVRSFDAGNKLSTGAYAIPTANIAGMTITLSQNGAAVKSVVSDANGVADFGIMAAGTYTVTLSQVNPYFPVAGFTLTLAQPTAGGPWTLASSDLGTRATGTISGETASVPEVVLTNSANADTPAIVDIHPSVTKLSFKVYVNSAESCDSSVRAFSPSGELGSPESVSFTLYGTYTSGSSTSDPIEAKDPSGNALVNGVVTGRNGVVTAYGMDYRAAVSGYNNSFYYAKFYDKSGAPNMDTPGTTDLFRIQMPLSATETCVITPGNINKTLTATDRPDTNSVVGTITHGAVAFTVNDRANTDAGLAGCKYDVYRLYEGDNTSNDDGRGDAKVAGSDENYDNSMDSASSVNRLSLSKLDNPLEQMLAVLLKSDPYALTASAAVTTTTYPQNTDNNWQKLATGVTSDSNGTVTINGLVPGQRYLLKQTAAPAGYSVTSNPIIIKTKSPMGDTASDNIASIVDYNGAAGSATSAVAQNGSGFKWLNGNGTAAGSGTADADTGNADTDTAPADTDITPADTDTGNADTDTGADTQGVADNLILDPAPEVTRSVGVTSVSDNGTQVTIDTSVKYKKYIYYTGKKVTPADLDTDFDITSLITFIDGLNCGYTGDELVTVKYISGKNLNSSSKAYFYPTVTLRNTLLRVAFIDDVDLKWLVSTVKQLNKELKANKCTYTIKPIDLSKSKVTIKAEPNTKGAFSISKKGVFSATKKYTVTVISQGGGELTPVKKQYRAEFADNSSNIVRISGLGDNFIGSAEVPLIW